MLGLKIANIFAFIAMVLTNILAETLPINGMTTGDISNTYPSIFTPAAITFSIWGVIYLAMAYFTFWQAFVAKDESVKNIGLSFTLSCALNIGWILAWHFNMLYLSTAIIILLLMTLNVIRKSVEDENWAVKASFSIYLSWITIASIASIFLIIGNIFKDFAFSPIAQVLAALSISIALIITFIRIKFENDIAYSLAMIWSMTGIMIKHLSPGGFGEKYFTMALFAGIAIAIIITILIIFYSKKKAEVIQV